MNDSMKCNLCNIIFYPNPLIIIQMERHEKFHIDCMKQKRNTVEGVVEWLKV